MVNHADRCFVSCTEMLQSRSLPFLSRKDNLMVRARLPPACCLTLHFAGVQLLAVVDTVKQLGEQQRALDECGSRYMASLPSLMSLIIHALS